MTTTPRRRKALGRLTVSAVAAVMLGIVPAGAAVAADTPGVGLSVDGQVFESGSIVVPAPGGAWVPGDVRTVTVWARNGSASRADATVDVSLVRESLFGHMLVMDVAFDGDPVALPAHTSLDAGQVVQIDVRLAFPRTSDNPSMRNVSALDLVLSMEGDIAQPGALPTVRQPDSGVSTGLLSVAGGLAALSVLMLLAGRRGGDGAVLVAGESR